MGGCPLGRQPRRAPDNEQISAWEQFAEAVHTYDGDSTSVPRQLQHAWGPVNESGYHGLPIPDFPARDARAGP